MVVGIDLGLSAAGQFRAAIQYGTSTCVTGGTHSCVPPAAAWVAMACVVITLVTTGLIATLLSGYLIHEISTCAALLST